MKMKIMKIKSMNENENNENKMNVVQIFSYFIDFRRQIVATADQDFRRKSKKNQTNKKN